MANRSRPTLLKREREKMRMEKQQQKVARRQESKDRRASAPPRNPDEDPDIAGIRPGPQPIPWADDVPS
jgi:hypothetical protein